MAKKVTGKIDVVKIMKQVSRETCVIPQNKLEIDRKKQKNKNHCRKKVSY
jgi:hypothetical protein